MKKERKEQKKVNEVGQVYNQSDATMTIPNMIIPQNPEFLNHNTRRTVI